MSRESIKLSPSTLFACHNLNWGGGGGAGGRGVLAMRPEYMFKVKISADRAEFY